MRMLMYGVVLVALASLAYAGDDLQGKITAIDAKNGTLEVSGVKVNAKKAKIENAADEKCTLSDLKVGDSVDIDGVFSGDGQMTAKEIEQEALVVDQVEGRVTSFDSAAQTLTISGVTVKVPSAAMIEDSHDKPIKLDQLKPGSRVDCEGTWTGPNELTATRIEVE